MAFYQDAPHQKRKFNPANQGSWDDEGSHYNKSSRPVHRFGPEAVSPCAADTPATAMITATVVPFRARAAAPPQ